MAPAEAGANPALHGSRALLSSPDCFSAWE